MFTVFQFIFHCQNNPKVSVLTDIFNCDKFVENLNVLMIFSRTKAEEY